MLRQAENRVKIEGILAENNLKFVSYTKDGIPSEGIGGEIKVLVQLVVNNEQVDLEIPVHTFVNKFTKDGRPNPAYESMEAVMKEYKSIASGAGIEKADRIRITSGSIRMNEYYSKKGTFVSFPRVYTSFVTKVTNDFHPEASWSLEFAISSMDFVTDSDGVELEPKKLRIKVIVPQYGGKIDTMELYATNPKVIDAITTYWENQKTYSAKGRLNFITTTQEITEECDFGEPEIRRYTTNINELIVTKGTQTAMDDDMAFSPAELNVALKEHKAYLETLKDKPMPTKKTPSQTSSNQEFDLGF